MRNREDVQEGRSGGKQQTLTNGIDKGRDRVGWPLCLGPIYVLNDLNRRSALFNLIIS